MKVKALMSARSLNLVPPLAHKATDKRTTDTTGQLQLWSGADTPLIGHGLRQGVVDSGTARSTRPTTRTTRTSTTATRTTTTSPGKSVSGSSADSTPSGAPFTFDQLLQAYLDCRRHKRNTPTFGLFDMDRERNLCELFDELQSGTYQPGRSICFVVTRPKAREVWAAEPRDRVVHHLLYNHIAQRFHASFAAASSACIPGRGTLYAANRLEHDVRSITRNWQHQAFYLKCDLANFFVAIDKHVLRGQLAARITEPWWLQLAELTLFHDPRTNVDVRSPAHLLARVPPHKSLFNAPDHHGLPIGNLSSQFFANVFLDSLDQHVKHQLRARYYVRYVDDFIILDSSPQVLNQALASVNAFLPARLHAHLNPRKTVLQPIARGIDFVGHVIKPHSHTTRRKTVRTALRRLEHMEPGDVFAAGNSYLGLLGQAAQSHTDQARICNALRKRGHAVSGDLSKSYRQSK